MPADLVSVIVPTYNRRYCLPNALGSVLAQTHTNWEVVLVDDGSTDGTAELVAEQFGADPRFRYFQQRNGGVSNARNTAIAHARGDFIAFLDSDDLWKPWKLEVQLACLHRFPELGMVWTDMEAIDPERNVIDPRHLRTMYSAYRFFAMGHLFTSAIPLAAIAGTEAAPDRTATFYSGDIYPSMIMGNLVHTSTTLLRRDRLLQVAGFDEELKLSGEDYDFHLRTCQFGPVGLIDLPAIQYQKGNPDQLTKHTHAIARNFLRTVERAIAGDQAHRFSPERVRCVLSDAHGWIAEEELKQRDSGAVRRHAWSSLQRRPLQPRILLLLVVSCLPSTAIDPMLRGIRSLKQLRRRR